MNSFSPTAEEIEKYLYAQVLAQRNALAPEPPAARFAFAIGAAVKIKALSLPARVELIQLSAAGTEYRVRYFTESKQETAWLWPDELEAGTTS